MQLIKLSLLFYLVYLRESKFIVKRKPKIQEPNELGVPQVPALAYDIYPGVEWHTLGQIYNEMIPGEDIAQIETMVGKALPMNAKLVGQVSAQVALNVNKFTNR
jgi:hypothetical protein